MLRRRLAGPPEIDVGAIEGDRLKTGSAGKSENFRKAAVERLDGIGERLKARLDRGHIGDR